MLSILQCPNQCRLLRIETSAVKQASGNQSTKSEPSPAASAKPLHKAQAKHDSSPQFNTRQHMRSRVIKLSHYSLLRTDAYAAPALTSCNSTFYKQVTHVGLSAGAKFSYQDPPRHAEGCHCAAALLPASVLLLPKSFS